MHIKFNNFLMIQNYNSRIIVSLFQNKIHRTTRWRKKPFEWMCRIFKNFVGFCGLILKLNSLMSQHHLHICDILVPFINYTQKKIVSYPICHGMIFLNDNRLINFNRFDMAFIQSFCATKEKKINTKSLHLPCAPFFQREFTDNDFM